MPAVTSAATAASTRGTVPTSHTGVAVPALLSLRSVERIIHQAGNKDIAALSYRGYGLCHRCIDSLQTPLLSL